jgi:hypothetical protein
MPRLPWRNPFFGPFEYRVFVWERNVELLGETEGNSPGRVEHQRDYDDQDQHYLLSIELTLGEYQQTQCQYGSIGKGVDL